MCGLLTGAVGVLLGCTPAGIGAATALSSMMSTAATTGVGMGVVSTLQSAGTVFAAATGGSVLAASSVVAAPVAAVVGLGMLLL